MAEEKKQESSSLTATLPAALVLSILAGLIFTHSLPYQDERPSGHPLQAPYNAAQDVDARLWQDPFAAVDGVTAAAPIEQPFIMATQNGKSLQMNVTSQSAKPSSHGPDWIYKDNLIISSDDITVLAVTLPGGPYQEAAEQRMRWRYAVLSALANRNAVPLDEQHIGYFHPTKKELQNKVPFEWWELSTEDTKKKILLLWVDESTLLREPHKRMQDLLCEASNGTSERVSFHYAVIGPNGSTLLRDMLEESVKSGAANAPDANKFRKPCDDMAKDVPEKNEQNAIVYYSAGATASDEELLKDIKPVNCKTVADCLVNGGVKLHRTSATDHEMMRILIDELEIRRVNPTDRVAVLSEWDTFYGRTMRDAFESEWKKKWNGDKSLDIYSYMRGLDGVLPDRSEKGGGDAKKKFDAKEKSDPDVLIEFPEGQNQKDYLRRLTDKIFELDRDLREKGEKGVAAIGVLGSDVHDKLMILEALRQHFPHKLIFTTDLDAVYSHPAKWPHTHNLLVASPFGLGLRDKLQDKIPPFRDSYQTAFFLATQLVLMDGSSIAERFGKPLPQLFEIGRSHPIPLPTKVDQGADLPMQSENGNDADCSWETWSSCKTVQPPIFTADKLLSWKVVAVVVLLIPFVSWRVREGIVVFFRFSRLHPYFVQYSVIAALVICYLLAGWWNGYLRRHDAEPFYWLEGVSVWPSQWLRLLAFLSGVGFFLWGKRRMRKMQNDFQALAEQEADMPQTFALPAAPDSNQIGHCEVLFVGSWKRKKNNDKKVYPDTLWKTYLGYCRTKKWGVSGCLLRVLANGLAFMAFARLLTMQSGTPNAPIRGDFANMLNIIIIWAAVLTTIFLTMWVVENARLCERLIFCLSEKPSQWNKNAKEWAIGEKNVAPECVDEWLDIQLVAQLTEKIQPLIWGPIICISLLVLARSPAIDDWDIPWGLGLVFITMLLYAISTEVFLQIGAKNARAKATDQLTRKIRAQRNEKMPDENAIKRIEAEIEYMNALCEGAFKPWYEWPLLQSFGGLGTLMIVLQYLAEVWRNGNY